MEGTETKRATVMSCTLFGIEARAVEVNLLAQPGSAGIQLHGLPPQVARESRERVRAALRRSGLDLPACSIEISFTPVQQPFSHPGFHDLAITLGLLALSGHISLDALQSRLICGELALDGSIRSVRGGLSIAELGQRLGVAEVLLPAANAPEAMALGAAPVVSVRSLTHALQHLTGARPIEALTTATPLLPDVSPEDIDLSDVRGQETAKRALEVAAAGGHHLLFVGPPGSGKTMLARRLPSLLPPLTLPEATAVTKIYSLVAEVPPSGLLVRRPFRSPHFGASIAGLTGGGTHPRPGEASLAHNGVLFLDDLPEYRRDTLESLRRPLDAGFVKLGTAREGHIHLPARFSLLAAMNPCPCGHLGDPSYACRCPPPLVDRYRARISGPFLDRIDLHVEVPAVKLKELRSSAGESSQAVARRVAAARAVQLDRFGQVETPHNAAMPAESLSRFCALDAAGRALLDAAFDKLGFSARAHERVLKVARTIADLAGSDSIRSTHLAEAIQYRALDRAQTR